MSLSDIAPLIAKSATNGLEYHQGTVITWDTVGHTNLIRVNNVDIPNMPFLGPDDPGMAAGALVAVLRYQTVYVILGRIREI